MTVIFDRAFDQLHSQTTGNGALLAPKRQEAMARLRELGLPTSRSEAWRNFSLGFLKGQQFERGDLKATEDYNIVTDHPSLVFIGGILQPSLSTLLTGDHGVAVKTVADCAADELAQLRQLMSGAKESDYQQKDAQRQFQSLLSESFIQEGVWLQATDRKAAPIVDVVAVAAPQDSAAAVASFPQIFAQVAEGCQLEVRQVFVDTAEDLLMRGEANGAGHAEPDQQKALSAPGFFADVAPRGILRHYLSHRETGTHIGKFIVRVAKDGQFDGFHLLQGKGRCRQEGDIVLAGPHADIQLNGLYLAEDGSRIDTDTRIHHDAEQTDSRQFYKGVIWDGGEGSFSGQIIVARDSQQVDAHQLNHNLLMGDKAIAHTRPQLAIDADDVKCAHGATVGSLKPEELFYLCSRGISKTRATQMLTLAFCRDVIDRVQSPSAKEWLMMELGHSKLI